MKANREMEKRRSSVKVSDIKGLFGGHNHPVAVRKLESAKMVKEENEDSEDTSEKYSRHFPPKQEDLVKEAKENKTLESNSAD